MSAALQLSTCGTEFTPSGLAYDVGWFAEDFLGTTDEHGHPRAFYGQLYPRGDGATTS